MTEQNLFQNYESAQGSTRIDSLVEKLRTRLKNFVVLDNQGELIGELKNIILDKNRQINFVISQNISGEETRQVLLISKLVQKIDPANKSVLVDINKVASYNLPQYRDTELSSMGTEYSSLGMPDAVGGTMQDRDRAHQDNASDAILEAAVATQIDANSASDVLEEEVIRLLGERVVVDRNRRKVGEVIVRKQIETRMIQVPVRREKLIVEQVGDENKRLAEIDLGEESEIPLTGAETINQDASHQRNYGDRLVVSGEFDSAKIASLLLNAIALERHQGYKKIYIDIVVDDTERQRTYQEWFDRSSNKKD